MSEKEKLDEIGKAYFKQHKTEEMFNAYTSKFILSKINGKNILELGCGDGIWTKTLIKKFAKVSVIDASKTLIDNLKKEFGEKVSYYCSLVEDFKSDEKFDAILAIRILEHIEDPVTILNKFKNNLSDNGKLIIVVPNAFSLHRKIGKNMGVLEKEDSFSEADSAMGHKRVYTKDLLLKHIEESGLKIQEFGGIGLKPLSNSQMDNWFSDELINAFITAGNDIPAELCTQLFVMCTK